MNRSWKKLLLKSLSPIDFAARLLNNKTHLPPLDLRWDVGPLRNFESSATEFRVYLKLFAGLHASSAVFDIGCGCGQIALELRDQLDGQGRYVGCDINGEAIAWCNAHIAAHDNRFRFFHMDVSNGMYNPHGKHRASEYKIETDGTFDIVLLKSVFTHMMTDDVANYISQIPRLLKPDGKCLATFFLLNDKQRSLKAEGKNSNAFHASDGTIAFANPDVPEAIVAFEEEKVVALAASHGLSVVAPIRFGTWSGDNTGTSHQDIVIFRRRL